MREKPENRERGGGDRGRAGGGRTGDKSNEEGLPVNFKTYQLLGPPNSWNNRLTPASPAPDGLPYNGKNHAMLSNGCYTFSLHGAQQLITQTIVEVTATVASKAHISDPQGVAATP